MGKHIDISRFTDHFELAHLQQLYLRTFRDIYPGIKPWPYYGIARDFGDNEEGLKLKEQAAILGEQSKYRIERALNGDGVYFDSSMPLNKDISVRAGNYESFIKEQSALAKQLVSNLHTTYAYFLAQNTPPEEVPTTLKVCIILEDSHLHFTSCVITVPNYRDVYSELLNKTGPFTNTSKNEDKRLGDANDLIDATLQLAKNYDTATIRRFVKLFPPNSISIDFFDSMNSSSFQNHAKWSIDSIKDLVQFNIIQSSQQSGCTCGDHSVINSFMVAMLGITPKLNSATFLSSRTLRKLTQLVKYSQPKEALALAKNIFLAVQGNVIQAVSSEESSSEEIFSLFKPRPIKFPAKKVEPAESSTQTSTDTSESEMLSAYSGSQAERSEKPEIVLPAKPPTVPRTRVVNDELKHQIPLDIDDTSVISEDSEDENDTLTLAKIAKGLVFGAITAGVIGGIGIFLACTLMTAPLSIPAFIGIGLAILAGGAIIGGIADWARWKLSRNDSAALNETILPFGKPTHLFVNMHNRRFRDDKYEIVRDVESEVVSQRSHMPVKRVKTRNEVEMQPRTSPRPGRKGG